MNAPFQYGTLATKENFVDRVEDRAQLKSFLSSHINVMLISPRRWGKSSLVKVAMEELQNEQKDIRVCFLDAFSIGSESEFYRTFASQVIACASTKLERRIQDAKKFLTGVVPQVVIKDDVTNFMAFDVKFTPGEQDKMDILRLPETLAVAKNIRIVVCIDEFQQLANLPEYKNMEGKMRSVWQQQQHVTYCMYGSKRHMMMDIFNDSNNPFYRFGQVLMMKKIEKEYWLSYIMEGFTKTGKRISEELASKICDTVACHSWYVQQFSLFVWMNTETEATEDIFNRQLQVVIDTNADMFVNDIESLAASQVAMLRAVSAGETQFNAKEVVERYGLGAPRTITLNKKTLIKRDIIEVCGNGYQFVDPVYALWFKREYM